MGITTINSGISNPFSTSGGGVTFEQLVGASYLVSLLASEIPRGLDWGITEEVKFQYRWSGCLLDDVVITSTDGLRKRKLAIQVKTNLTFSDAPSNKLFARVIEDCWKTFTNSLGWEFNQNIDRIGIGIGVHQNKVENHFKPLLEWARTSRDETVFIQKVSISKFSSREKQEYLNIIRNLLKKIKGSEISDYEIWRFLRCLVVVHFDLTNAGSRDSTYCWNKLLDQLKNRDEGQARLLFNSLTSYVAEYARSAGSFEIKTLRDKIPGSIVLKDQINLISEISHLRDHSNIVLESITDTIGGKIHLPRTEILNQIEASIKKSQIVVINGEPMVGKSVLLKLLANRLRSDGEIIALSVERFSGATLEIFLHNIHIQRDLQSVLSGIGNAPLRCILIDGLEKAVDEDKKRILNDLIIAIRKYNDSILEKGGHKDSFWRVVFTCRLSETRNILVHLETRRNLMDNSLSIIKVEALQDEEIEEVVSQLPKLKDLASMGHLKDIFSRPLILDILTLPEIVLPPDSVPSTLSESWLLEWFWKEVIRLADGRRPGRGEPDKREHLLMCIARESLKGNRSLTIRDDTDSDAVSGLVSDRILIRENNNFRFTHDVLEDWTLTTLFKRNEDKIIGFLTETIEPLRLINAFRLYASGLLEVEQSTTAWFNLLSSFEKTSTLSPRWNQIILTAPLFSPLLVEILPKLQSYLFNNEGVLLSSLLKALRTICVQPDPEAFYVLGGLPQEQLEKYLAYWSIPVWKQWVPIVQMVLQNPDVIKDEVLFEFSHIAEKWMKNTEKSQLFRKEIAELSLKILSDGMLQSHEVEPKNQNIKSVLWAADCIPDMVDDFIKQKALRDRESKNYGFEELILDEGWIPICKYLPQTAIDILEAILCEKIEPDRFGSYYHLFTDMGIKYTYKWSPPTYLKGPFLGFLRFYPDVGLELIHRIINHATQCWKIREESERNRKPIPQIVKLEKDNVKVYGDELVYSWYRYPSVAPVTITCALMALEYWMNEQIKNGDDSKVLFEKVLQDTESVAVVGVCSSVALANQKASYEAIIPILENPAFWIMDIDRFVKDLRAESSVNMFSKYLSFGHERVEYKILLELASQHHRKLDIRSFVLPIMQSGSKLTKVRLKNSIQAFPDNLPFLFEHEKEDKFLIQERIETCKIWAEQVEIENYEVFETGGEGQIGIRFKLPTELEEKQKEKVELLEERNKLSNLLGWSMNLLDNGEVSQSFTIESAMAFVQDLIRQDDPLYRPQNFFEDSELRAQAIASFAAALVLRQWHWVEKNDCVTWCREQIIIAAERPEPPEQFHDRISRFSMGYKRSAARALPILLSKNPNDRKIRRVIFELSGHKNYEVKAYLFNAFKVLWSIDSKIIWKCIYSVIKESRQEANKRIVWYLKEQTKVIVTLEKYAGIKRFIERMKRTVNLMSRQIYPKSLKNCSSIEIDPQNLQSILYCLPLDIQIIQISSSDELVDFLEDLLLFTINTYKHYQKDRHNEWAHNDWNRLFFPIVANALLRLPQNIAEPGLRDPIINYWENTPAMMEELLRQLILKSSSELEEKFIELWLYIGDQILSSENCKSPGYYLNDEIKNILGLLIFAGPFLTWNIQEWPLLTKITPFISRWCNTIGYHPDCFPSLVRLLKTIGFNLIPEFGIGWLYNSLIKVDNHSNFFERTRIASLFAELLYDAWLKQETAIKNNSDAFRYFSYLVDVLAEQGEGIAIILQSKLS